MELKGLLQRLVNRNGQLAEEMYQWERVYDDCLDLYGDREEGAYLMVECQVKIAILAGHIDRLERAEKYLYQRAGV